MAKYFRQGCYYMDGKLVKESEAFMTSDKKERAIENTVARAILREHNRGDDFELQLTCDLLAASGEHYPDLIRTADDAGLSEFPVPFVLFGGEGKEAFGRSAAEKFGGRYVTEYAADYSVYLLDRMAKSGDILLGCDNLSCGAVGALTFDDDEGALLRRLFGGTYDLKRPETAAVFLKGKLRKGVGSTDVALAVLGALGDMADGKILEVFGTGLARLTMGQRAAIDSLLYASGALASVWATDGGTEEFFASRGRADAFRPLSPTQPAYYECGVSIDLSSVEPMCRIDGKIRTVREVLEKKDVGKARLKEGRVCLLSAVITSYATDYETIAEIAESVRGKKLAPEAHLFIPSQPVFCALAENGYLPSLIAAGFDLEASAPDIADINGLEEDCATFDAYTLAYSLLNGGYLTSALGFECAKRIKKFRFDPSAYESREADFIGKGRRDLALAYGEEVEPIPELLPLPDSAQLTVAEDGGDEKGTLALLLSDPEDYPWASAITDRERGVLAALSKEFPRKLRTHLIDWGIVPLTYEKFDFKEGDVLFLDKIREQVSSGEERFVCSVVGKRRKKDIALTLGTLTEEERKILLSGGKNNVLRAKKR